MRFVHISDTHLGAGFGSRISSAGVNQREEDICNSFEFAINKIIELKPNFVIHSGDFFHSVRPSNRIINFAIRQVKRLSDLNLPVVIISGNHDTPKQRSVGSIFSLFEIFDNIFVVHKNMYEVIKLSNAAIHCIPHCLTTDIFLDQLKKLSIDKRVKHNILVLHVEVVGVRELAFAEIGGLQIPDSMLNLDFDYIALGHYHKFQQIKENAYYSGSTERITLRDIGDQKVIIEYDLDTKALTSHQVPVRERIYLDWIDATDLNQEKVFEKLEEILTDEGFKDKMVILKVVNIPEHVYNLLPFRKINELKNKIFMCDLRFEKRTEEDQVQISETSIGRLSQEFSDYLASIPLVNLDRSLLLQLGFKYLSKNKTGVE